MDNTYLALDFGGTKLVIGEVDGEGRILRSKQYRTGPLTQRHALQLMCVSLDDYLAGGFHEGRRPESMGVGLNGRIDATRGLWLQIDPLRDEILPVGETLSQRYGMPCHVDNDVKSATRAEMLWGAGRGMRHFVYINVGTGIAAGAVMDGRVVRGAHCDAGEVGYMVSNVGLAPGAIHECIEDIASGAGIDRCARLLRDRYPGTTLSFPAEGRVDVRDVLVGCRQGDPLCRLLACNAAESLAALITNMVKAFDPEGLILGGGVVADGFLLDMARKKVSPRTVRFLTQGIRLTGLDPHYAGLLGAAAVAQGKLY